MNINSAFPNKYLKADVDITEDVLATIKTVKIESVGQGAKTEQKPVVYFDKLEKGLVLNKTNAKMIAKIAKSDDTDDWKGTKIRLIATEVEFQGELVMGIRVRELKRAAKQATDDVDDLRVEAPSEDDIPFAIFVPFFLTASLFAHALISL